MSNISHVLGLALSLSTIGCVVGEGGPGASNENIIGGAIDNGDPSVVQIRYQVGGPQGIGGASCTATVISPTALLTAAHCSQGFNYEYNPATSADPGNSTGWISAGYAQANPSYTGATADGHDVGIVTLFSATSIAPSPLGAAPAAGASVRVVGYGLRQAATSGTAGEKDVKSVAVASVAQHEFVAGPNDTCHGDSGGPVFDSANNVVGTVSYGDTADCNGNDHFMRVDDNLAWINSVIATAGGGGGGGTSNTCDVSTSINGSSKEVRCSNGTCTCFLAGAQTSTCTDNGNGCSIPGSCCGF
jgi:V8-like Glu-specific endopeptidase